jgi:TPR repeat protein
MIRTLAAVSAVMAGLAAVAPASAQMAALEPAGKPPLARWDMDSQAAQSLRAAEAGDAKAQYNTGIDFFGGRGVARDAAAAAKWFRRSAEQGDPERQYNIGRVYMGYVVQGRNAPAPDYGEATTWFRRAADQGHARAQHELGDIYDFGFGVAADPAEATKWYRRAAAENGGDGYMLGLRYLVGLGESTNYAEAATWLRQAAERRNPAAMFCMGIMHEYGLGVPRDHAEAAKWYRRAADPYGVWAKLGFDIFRDPPSNLPQHALIVARRKADARGAEAQYRLGYLYEHGLGVLEDRAEATTWYRRAAERNDARAQYRLGVMHERGEGMAQDLAEAARWYRAAAIQGSALAQTKLGLMHQSGAGVPADTGRAAMWLRLAASHRWAPDPASRDGYTAAANLESAAATQALAEAQLVAAVERIAPDSHRDALRLMRVLAERGYVKAQYYLAHVLENGPMNTSQGPVRDGTEAAMWYARAAHHGHAGARLALAWKYLAGRDLPRDQSEAARWTRAAAEQGVVSDRTLQGDHAEGLSKLQRSAERGSAPSQEMLAGMYEVGEGVPRDLVQAHKWYDLAVRNYHPDNGIAIEQASRNQERVAMMLTGDQLAEARKAADDWRPAPNPMIPLRLLDR